MAITHHLTAVVVLIVLFIFTTSSSLSSARILNVDFLSHGSGGLAATEPTLNLALPIDNDVDDVVDNSATTSKDQVLPCDHMVPIKKSHEDGGEIRLRSPKLAGKYGPMILSMLPRGPVPSSGPSKGTNDVKN